MNGLRIPAWAPRLLTPAETRAALRVSQDQLRRLRDKRAIGALRLPSTGGPGHHRYLADDVEALAAKNERVAR